MMTKLFNISHLTAGFTAVLVGYTSSVVIIIQAATASGASAAQIESWLLVLGVAMGLTSVGYSWYYKTPVLTAWSTPGAAMLVGAVSGYSMAEVIGAFGLSGLFILVTGLISPLSKALQRIPTQLGTAMLGAILLPFCLRGFETISSTPAVFLTMFTVFLLARTYIPKYMMLALLVVGVFFSLYINDSIPESAELSFAMPFWVSPEFSLSAMLNLSVPLYLITMISQNLPGVAMMKSYGYKAPVKSVLIGTGLTNILFAPFGGLSVNLAAISAAICMTPDVDTDKNQRYRAVIWAGVFYLIAGLFATSVVSLFLAFPHQITSILAGFALLGTLLMCLQAAFKEESYKDSAMLTFLITLSGISFLGINSTLWGLIIGLLHLHIARSSK